MFLKIKAKRYLLHQGVQIDEYGCFSDFADFRIRILDDQIQFGWVYTFDRWANSVDFVLYVIPDMDVPLADLLHFCLNKGLVNSGWGEDLDIYPFLRKFRKERAKAGEAFVVPRQDGRKLCQEMKRKRGIEKAGKDEYVNR